MTLARLRPLLARRCRRRLRPVRGPTARRRRPSVRRGDPGQRGGTGIFTDLLQARQHLSLARARRSSTATISSSPRSPRASASSASTAAPRSARDLVRFHREGDRVELWVVNPHMAAAPGTPMARTVAYSFGHSVAQSFPIAAVRDARARSWSTSRRSSSPTGPTSARCSRPRWPSASSTGTVSLDDKRSSLQSLRLFRTNLEAEVRLTFQTPAEPGPRDRRRLPLDPDRHPLLAAASCRPTPMRPRLGRRPGGLLRLGHQGLLPRHRGELLRPLREPLAAGEAESGPLR